MITPPTLRVSNNDSNTCTLTVTATGGTGARAKTATQNLTVRVTDVNEAPVFANTTTTFNVPENSRAVATKSATDEDSADSVTYALSGTDADLFSISTAGRITFDNAPNFESPGCGSNNDSNTCTLTVTATGGTGARAKTATQNLTVRVTDVNEAPVFANTTTTFNVPENSRAVATKSATDEDSADSVTYALSGTDADLFSISTAGRITFDNAPNFESPGCGSNNDSNTCTLTVTATGGTGARAKTATQNLTVRVTDVNEAPVFANTTTTFNVPENSRAVATKSATDEDSADSVTYALSGTDADLFSISTAGRITFDNAPNFESPGCGSSNNDSNTCTLTVTATGGTGARAKTATQNLTVRVTDVNEAPVFANTTTTFNVPENSRAVATKSATDEDSADSVTYALSGTDADLFSISTAGRITFDNAPNFESPGCGSNNDSNTCTLTVTATGGTGARAKTATQNLTVRVTDVSELPTITIAAVSSPVSEDVDVAFILTANPAPSAQITVRVSVNETPRGAFLDPNATVPNEITIDVGATTAHLILQTDNDAVDEANGTIRATILSDLTGTGYTIGHPDFADVTVEDNDVQLTAPTNLDITPLSLRRARLSWKGDPNANIYVVEVQKTGTNDWRSPNLSEQTNSTAVIDLDIVWHDLNSPGNQGMADLATGDSYEYRILSRHDDDTSDNSDPYVDSDFSDEIRIIDNPLLASGGRAYGSSSNQATLKWTVDTSATNYSIRYRQLSSYTASTTFGIKQRDHTHLDWPRGSGWPYYDNEDQSHSETSDTPGNEIIGSLDEDELYAFQINYQVGDTKVFSARDAYVWPSSDFPGNAERVGTYTFFGHWKGGRYDYTVCSDTFDKPTTIYDEGADWAGLINHAFEQWERAAPDLLTVTHVAGSCTVTRFGLEHKIDNTSPFTLVWALHNGSNEVYMVDTSNWHGAIVPFISDNLLFLCIEGSSACVISSHYFDVRRSAGRPLDDGSVDVLVNASRRDGTDVAGGSDTVVDAEDIRFNTCQGTALRSWANYELMVHEAGHALGLSNVTLSFRHRPLDLLPPQPYEAAHPTIPDSVMNYDSGVQGWAPWAPSTLNEPDCSPHPFDIMAIEALYPLRGGGGPN